MITLIAAAALAAQAPAAPAHADAMTAQHAQHQQRGPADDQAKDCCKDMAGKHEGHDAEHGGHAAE